MFSCCVSEGGFDQRGTEEKGEQVCDAEKVRVSVRQIWTTCSSQLCYPSLWGTKWWLRLFEFALAVPPARHRGSLKSDDVTLMGLDLKKRKKKKMFQMKFLGSICTSGPDRGDLVSHIWHEEVLQRGLVLDSSVAKSSVHIFVLLQSNSDLLLGFTGSGSVNLS